MWRGGEDGLDLFVFGLLLFLVVVVLVVVVAVHDVEPIVGVKIPRVDQNCEYRDESNKTNKTHETLLVAPPHGGLPVG